MHPASRDQALAAVREFHAEHGRLPRWREWEEATASRPCAKTIERRWGWRKLLAKAIGVRPNQVDVSWGAILDDRDQAMLATLRAAREGLGRWPTAAQWDAGGRRPSAWTFTRHFGGWREACWAAEPRGQAEEALRARVGATTNRDSEIG
jgi:Homing endonuclease associated repeat